MSEFSSLFSMSMCDHQSIVVRTLDGVVVQGIVLAYSDHGVDVDSGFDLHYVGCSEIASVKLA